MARTLRLRYRDLVLAVVVALTLDVVAALLVYLVDLSPLGPLRRLHGPWGLPCLAEATCPAPCPPCPPPCAEKADDMARPTVGSLHGGSQDEAMVLGLGGSEATQARCELAELHKEQPQPHDD